MLTEVCSAGFPHSDISGSMDICSSPKLFAAYHVFHRLLVPRHPPCALFRLTIHKKCSVISYGSRFVFRSFLFISPPQFPVMASDVFFLSLTFDRSSSVSVSWITICGFQGTYSMRPFGFILYLLRLISETMEMERFELLTPCLQGRCSPN